MLDVSDGLARDAARIAKASGVVLEFHSARMGADPSAELRGAEDHGLLATFPPSVPIPHPFEVLGNVTAASGGPDVTLDGRPVDVAGWDPYAGWDGVAG